MASAWARVAVARPVGRLLSYQCTEDLQPGQRVLVPLGNSRCTGLVLECGTTGHEGELRPIEAHLDAGPIFDAALCQTLAFACQWYRCDPGQLVRAALPAGLGISAIKSLIRLPEKSWPTSPALEAYERLFDGHRAVAARDFEKGTLQALLASGAVSCDTRVTQPAPEPTIELIRAKRDPESLPKRNRSQRQLLEHLIRVGDWVPTQQLRAFKGLRRLIKLLEASDFIERMHQSLSPAPTDADTVPKPTAEQEAVLKAVDLDGGFAQHLLYGVTGSGKTEVYLQLIQKVLDRGKSALVLVPEIALTPQMVSRFSARFGPQVAVFHSGLKDSERRSSWYRSLRGESRIAIGARSAVFAPCHQLGLIIVDEEHDSSYKQGENPRYHGRDLAIVRAKNTGCPIVLGSATPSLETWHRAHEQRQSSHLHHLRQRATGATLPVIDLVKLKEIPFKDRLPISPPLQQAIERTLARKEQAILLLNRRGWAPLLTCLDCGVESQCPHCSVALVSHRPRRLVCHYCGYEQAPPTTCHECQSSNLGELGQGTQQLENSLRERFPQARVGRLDSDVGQRRGAMQSLLERFAAGELDLVVGTQMLAKGHDLPSVTLVGVILADRGLQLPDPRGGERAFQLLTQVAGRAGRAGKPGRVLFQCFDSEHPVIQAACDHDGDGFLQWELERRRAMGLPPFTRAALIRCSHQNKREAAAEAMRLSRIPSPGCHVLGPAPSVIERLRERWRFQFLITAERAQDLQSHLSRLEAQLQPQRSGVRVAIDVDPSELM
ncbi:MAG: primosomal protein N' [Myxococcales bacterium]|nr:primosomal protein N' [Myxococcales bacterium]